jgi:hypothetical protein
MAMADQSCQALTLYSRAWCHLCDDMEKRFGEWVPVLMHGDRELCHYHLDSAAVTDYLRKIR